MSEHIAGYEITIHRSLSTPILVMGVSRSFALLNGGVAAVTFLSLHSVAALPLCLFFHLVAVAGTKKDEQFFEVFRRIIYQKKFYRA